MNRAMTGFSKHSGSQRARRGELGFTLFEMMLVGALTLIIAAIAVPQVVTIVRNFRTGGDARQVNGLTALAKMRGAAKFTEARINVDYGAGTYSVETWNKTSSTWVKEFSPQYFSSGVTVGFGSLSSPPSGTQSSIGLAAACKNLATGGTSISNTACIVFNSRGIPVDSTGAPTAQGAIYLTDGTSVYAITVTATGLIQTWRSPAASASWTKL